MNPKLFFLPCSVAKNQFLCLHLVCRGPMFDLPWLEILPLFLCFRIATIGSQNRVRLFVLNSGGVPHKWRCRSKTERVCSQGNIFKVSQEEIKIKKAGKTSDRIETRGILHAWKFKWILVCGSFYSLSNGFHVLSGVRMGSDRHLDENTRGFVHTSLPQIFPLLSFSLHFL